MTTAELIGELARRGRPDAIAVVDANGATTYGELARETDRLTGALLGRGLRRGDRIALVAPNRVETLQAVLAASLAGVTVVPVNLRLRPEDIRFQAEDAGVRFTVIDPALERLGAAAGLLDGPHWFIGDTDVAASTDLTAGAGAPPRSDRTDRPDRPDAALIQLYTSGTTGRPKGCLLSDRGWLASTASLAELLGLHGGDVVATPLPFFHVAGLHFALSTLSRGATLAMPAGPGVADAWSCITEFGVTVVQTMGSCTALLDAAPGAHPLRGVYGLPARPDDLDGADPRIEFWTGYGSTELCGLAVGHGRAGMRERPGSIGRPMRGFEAAVVDESGRPVLAGEVGELLMRGPGVTSGYWNLPAESADALRGGWLHTGDLVSAESDGCLHFVDRLKDMIKTGGENVYCVEVEQVLGAHPAVAECAVIGVPDARWGEAVKAVLTMRSPVTAADLDAWCLAHLAAYKRPRWYEFVEALPRNALTKVRKTELRADHDPARAVRLAERTR